MLFCFKNFINEHDLSEKAFSKYSVDLKQNEVAIQKLAEVLGVDFLTFSVEQLKKVGENFSASEFVLRTVGVENVCERSALCVADTLILKKTKMDGITFAVAMKNIELRF